MGQGSSCLLCGEENRELLIREGEWTVYRCRRCGLGILDPKPSADRMESLYRNSYFLSHYDDAPTPGSPQMQKRLSWEAHRLRFFRPHLKSGRILDIGSGRGYFLLACRNRGYEVEGFDLSEDAAEYVRNTLKITVTTGTIDNAPFKENSFDLITMWHSLEHTENPHIYLELAHRWLKPDGLLIVEVPNHLGTDALRYGKDWEGWSLPYHLCHFTPESLEKLLLQHDFKIIGRKSYHSNWVKMKLRRIPVLSIFARLIAKCFSGTGYAVVARRLERR